MVRSLWNNPARPYVFPFLLFCGLLSLESLHPLAVYIIYPIKTVAVGLVILFSLPKLPNFSLNRPWTSILVGIVAFVAWVGLDPIVVHRAAAESELGFHPWTFHQDGLAWILIAFRIFGASVVVPITEELFWRGFLMRYIIKENFEEIPLGTYQHLSFWITTAAFASIHGPQWPLGVVVGILYGAWFVRTKSLGNIMLAHGTTNFLLGVYILATGRYYFW